jgi:hypothetical protein
LKFGTDTDNVDCPSPSNAFPVFLFLQEKQERKINNKRDAFKPVIYIRLKWN